jgi:5-methylcytosine-specific restriction endonuclease McrA
MPKGVYLKSKDHKRKLSESKIGIPRSEETKRRMSETNSGKPKSEETKRKISKRMKGKPHSNDHNKKIAESLKGIVHSIESRRKLSITLGGDGCIENREHKRYPPDFTIELKIQIKIKYHGVCQLCGCRRTLVIHHIDYDKKNTSDSNLIPLCNPCHGKTNIYRDKYRKLFQSRNGRPILCYRPKLLLHIQV